MNTSAATLGSPSPGPIAGNQLPPSSNSRALQNSPLGSNDQLGLERAQERINAQAADQQRSSDALELKARGAGTTLTARSLQSPLTTTSEPPTTTETR